MWGSGRKVAVVGAGPAGISAAQQCIREGIEQVVVLEKDKIGGLIYQANRIENFPGFVGSEGPEFVEELEQIIDDYGIEVVFEKVESISKEEDIFILEAGEGNIRTEYLVNAVGTEPKKTGLEGEIHHPGWKDYTGKNILVIGGGDTAYDYSLRLNRLGGEVKILRRSSPKALDSLVNEVRDSGIEEIKGEVEDITVGETGYVLEKEDERFDIPVTAIGREPVEISMDFTIEEIDFPSGRTDIGDFYSIGSAVLGKYRQTSLCWGMGTAAGMNISGKIDGDC